MFRLKEKMSRRAVASLIIAAVVVLLGVITYAFYQVTLVDLPGPAAGGAALGMLSSFVLWKPWRRLTRSRRWLPNAACQAVSCSVALVCLFFFCNYVFADRENTREEKVAIVEKHTSTRHRSRRVGRARYIQGEAYTVYDIDVRFSSGFVREMQVSVGDYSRYRVGDSIRLSVARGWLGMPVIIHH